MVQTPEAVGTLSPPLFAPNCCYMVLERLHVAVYVAFFPDLGTVEIMTAAAGQNDVGNFFFLFHNLSPPRTLPKHSFPKPLSILSLFSLSHAAQGSSTYSI